MTCIETEDAIGAKIARAAERSGEFEIIVEIDGQRFIGDVISGHMNRADGLNDTDDYRCLLRTDNSVDIEFLVSNDGYGWIGETASIKDGANITPKRSTDAITRFEILN